LSGQEELLQVSEGLQPLARLRFQAVPLEYLGVGQLEAQKQQIRLVEVAGQAGKEDVLFIPLVLEAAVLVQLVLALLWDVLILLAMVVLEYHQVLRVLLCGMLLEVAVAILIIQILLEVRVGLVSEATVRMPP
jgi:hypothetical protein